MAALKIDGVEYEIPDGTLKLREARIVERYCEGNSTGDGYGIARAAGLIHVAMLRSKPGTSFEEIQAVVDEIDMDALNEQMQTMAATQGDADPPATESSDVAEPSSEDSSPASEPSLENGNQSSTGHPLSPIGSESFHATSAI